MGNEFVIVYGQVPEEVDLPFWGKLVGHIGLQVNKIRIIFGIRIGCFQKGAPCFITETGHLCELAGRTSHISIGPQQAGGGRTFESFRFFVGDVQYGTHLVSITGFKSSGGKVDGFCHVRVDKTQPFLLSGTDE